MLSFAAEGRNRTDTELPPPDFESGASTSSATPANDNGMKYISLSGLVNVAFIDVFISPSLLAGDNSRWLVGLRPPALDSALYHRQAVSPRATHKVDY